MNLSQIAQQVNQNYSKPIETDGLTWIRNNVVLAGSHQGRGPFSFENHGWLLEPMKALLDDDIKTVCLIKPSKSGGSTLIDACLPLWISNSVSKTILLTWVSDPQAARHAKEKLYPTLQASGINLPIDKEQTKKGISFDNLELIVGGPSKSQFEDTDADIVVCDEPHSYPAGRLTMAANRVLAAERETGFSKFVLVSRGSYLGDTLHSWFVNGSMHTHQVPCLSCKEYFTPSFKPECFIFDASSSLCKTEEGYNFNEIRKTIRMKCPSCGHLHEDGEKLKKIWSNSRKYKQMNEGAADNHKSFTWSPFCVDDWDTLTQHFLLANKEYKESGAKKDFSELIEFRQTRLAEFAYHPKDVEKIGEIEVDFKSVISSWGEDATLRLMSIDIQTIQGVYWVCIMEYKKNVDGQMLWYGLLNTESDLIDLQKKYDIPPECVMIDISDSPSVVGYPYMERNGWIGLKGDGNHDSYIITTVTGEKKHSYISSFNYLNLNNKKIRWLFFAKQPICDITNKFIAKRGKVNWTLQNNTELKRQIRKVRREEKEYNRIKRWVWVDDKTAHGWDCLGMQVAGCILHKSKVDIMDVISEYSVLKDTGLYITKTHLPTKKLEFDDAY